MKIILIMGLPGSGKTTLAEELAPLLNAKRLNADEVRKEANDWDFSEEGRKRQARRMADFALRLKEEGNETVTNCHGLKMLAADGKMRMTDVADVEQLFRLIQSIPSPKSEPFKLWLAQVGSERLDEMQDPELSIDRALDFFDIQHLVFGVRHWLRFGISY